jgi:acetyl-CoA C-acetyltransferase
MKNVYIYDSIRTPRGKGRKDGALHEVSALNLSVTAIDAIAGRNGLEGHAVEDVIWGNVTQVGEQLASQRKAERFKSGGQKTL